MQAMKEVGLLRSDAGVVVNTEEGSKPPGEGGRVVDRMYNCKCTMQMSSVHKMSSIHKMI